MKCLCHIKSACHRFGRIHLVDKCLLLILMLLMLQSALNLFIHEANATETNSIDVVVRTSASGIFGYLISVNFNQQRKRRRESKTGGSVPQSASGQGGGVTAQIGFHSGAEGSMGIPAPPLSVREDTNPADRRYDRAQILAVGAVGVLSLLILLIYRNFACSGNGNAGSVTQFRDFVSGSVGFLISCSTSGVGNEEK